MDDDSRLGDQSRLESAQQQGSPTWFYRFFQAYAIYALVLLGLLYADFFSHPLAPDSLYGSTAYRFLLGLVIVPSGLVVSLLVLQRTHHNVTGLFLLIYTTMIMAGTLRVDSPLQILNNLFDTAWIGLWLLPLYFPDGTAQPMRFQKWIRLHSLTTSIFFVGSALLYTTMDVHMGHGQILQADNPLMIPALQPIAGPADLIQGLTWFTTVLMIIPSIILRYRASRGIVRQQIKLFVWTFGIFIGVFIAAFPFFSDESAIEAARQGVFGPLLLLYEGILFPALPFAVVGYAILRHRLYNIDVIIRRTLIYSTVTAVLAMAYFGLITLLQVLTQEALGEQSPLLVVLSTLVIAALFNPLRRRVQILVDQRFYRRKYDIGHTLESFSVNLRDEVDLDRLSAVLVGVVDAAMQPRDVGLWINDKKSRHLDSDARGADQSDRGKP